MVCGRGGKSVAIQTISSAEGEQVRRLVLSLLACLSVANVNTRAAEPAKIELMLLKTVTVTEEQFLLGSQDGRLVTLAVELRLPTAGTARLPAMILLHGSGGI